MTKCEACRTFFLFFPKEFNKFNNTEARMLDSIYHITLNVFEMAFGFGKKTVFCHMNYTRHC